MMKTTTSLFLAVAVGLLFTSQNSRAEERRALLVHVSQYKDPKVPTLGVPGAVQQDIPVMDTALKTLHFKTTDLQNSHASRQDVMKALDDLASVSKPEDAVVLYFSGHGAHTDKLFSLCPWDALFASGQNDITEGDLQQWLDRLKSRNVTLILDCCFSRLGTRGVVREMRVKFMGRSDNDLIRNFEQVQIPVDRAVILSAASQNGSAMQANLYNETNRWAGLFTFYLGKRLKTAATNPATTFRNVMDDVKQDVQERLRKMAGGQGYMQVPAIYGSDALVNRPLFAPVGAAAPPPPADTTPPKEFTPVKESEPGKIVLPIGKEDGITKGSELAVFPKDDTKLTDKTKEIAKVKVVEVKDHEAIAVPVEGTTAKPIPVGSHATLTRYENDVNKDSNVVIWLDGDAAFQSQMRSALEKMAFIRFADDAKASRHLVIRGSAGAEGVQAQLYDPDSESKSPLDPDSKGVSGSNAAEVVSKITPQLNQLAGLRTLFHLKNPNPDFHLTLTSGKNVYVEGENATFTCKTDRDCYIILYSVDAAGYPDLLFPSSANQSNRVKAGETLSLPPAEPIDGKIATYEVLPPFSKTTIFALATTNATMADSLKKRLFEMKQPDAPGQSGARAIRFKKNLQDLQTVPLDTWSVTALDVLTLSKAEAAGGGAR